MLADKGTSFCIISKLWKARLIEISARPCAKSIT